MAIKFNKIYISLFFAILLQCFCVPVFAETKSIAVIKWEYLNLSNYQKFKIQNLDYKWKIISSNLRNKILNNQNNLKYMLRNPFSSNEEIRKLQNKILANQQQLRYKAMEIFLKKRNVLTIEQKERLHQMIFLLY